MSNKHKMMITEEFVRWVISQVPEIDLDFVKGTEANELKDALAEIALERSGSVDDSTPQENFLYWNAKKVIEILNQ